MTHVSRQATNSLKNIKSKLPLRPLFNNNHTHHQFHTKSLHKHHCMLSAYNPSLHNNFNSNCNPSRNIVYHHTNQNIHTLSSNRKFLKFRNTSNHHSNFDKLNYYNYITKHNFVTDDKRDYYETLGIERDAKDADVKKAFYKVC